MSKKANDDQGARPKNPVSKRKRASDARRAAEAEKAARARARGGNHDARRADQHASSKNSGSAPRPPKKKANRHVTSSSLW